MGVQGKVFWRQLIPAWVAVVAAGLMTADLSTTAGANLWWGSFLGSGLMAAGWMTSLIWAPKCRCQSNSTPPRTGPPRPST